MTLRIGIHFIRRRILDRAEAHGGRVAHTSVFRCASGFDAMAELSDDEVRYEIWDEKEPAEDFVRRCDALVGIPDIRLLNARERTGRRLPYLALVMGDATRAVPFSPVVMAKLQPQDTLVCTCSADQEILRSVLEAPTAHSVDFGAMPADLSQFVPRHPLPPQWAEALARYPADRPLVLSAERMTEAKGVHRVLPFAAGLRDLGHRPVVVFLGAGGDAAKGSYQTLLEERAAEAGLADSCLFLPFAEPEQLATLYARATLTVSMSTIYDNNYGYVPIESMAAGTPPVVTDWGGYRDSVLNGRTGVHAPTTLEADNSVTVDCGPAVAAADRLLRDEHAYRRMVAAGGRHAEDTYSVPASFARYAHLARVALERDADALPPWGIGPIGRLAQECGWTDQTDNADRTGRVPRGGQQPGPAYQQVYQSIYRHYATRVREAQ